MRHEAIRAVAERNPVVASVVTGFGCLLLGGLAFTAHQSSSELTDTASVLPVTSTTYAENTRIAEGLDVVTLVAGLGGLGLGATSIQYGQTGAGIIRNRRSRGQE